MTSTKNAQVTFNTGGVITGTISSTGTHIHAGSIIGYAGNPSPAHGIVGSGGGGVMGGMDIMYDMEGVRLEEGQNVVVAFGNGVTGKLRIGRISDVRRDVGEIVVTWQRGWDIPKRPSRIKVSENRILVVA